MRSALDVVAFMTRHLEKGNVPAAVRCALLDLNLPDELEGYRYLISTIDRYSDDPEQSFTKELYAEVGRHCGAGRMQVEKSIRYAIGKGWERRLPGKWESYFQHGRKPTNGEFIARITEILYLWQACCEAKAEEP